MITSSQGNKTMCFDSETAFNVIDDSNDNDQMNEHPVSFDSAIECLCDHVAMILSLNFDSDCDEQSTFTFKFDHSTGQIKLIYDRYLIAHTVAVQPVDDAFTSLCHVATNIARV